MSRIGDLQKAFEEGDYPDRQNISYLLDLIEVSLSYILAQAELPDALCQTCEYQKEGVGPHNCEQPIDDCQEPMLLFLEAALDTWLSTRDTTEEVEEQ